MSYARSRKKWNDQERETLIVALATSTTHPRDIAIPGRSPNAVERKAQKLGLTKRSAPPHWSPKERASLRRLHKTSLTAEEMSASSAFREPRRSTNAIAKKRSKLRLIHNRRRSNAAKHRKIWQNGELESFENFLRSNSNHLATEEIAKLFHISKPTVRKHQRRLGVNLSYKEAIQLPYSVRKRQLNDKKRRRRMLKHHRRMEPDQKKQLLDLAKMYREKYPDTLEQECPACQLSFPKSRYFYYYRDTLKDSFTCRLFDRHCKVCTSIRRRQKRRKDHQRALRKTRQPNSSPHKNPVD